MNNEKAPQGPEQRPGEHNEQLGNELREQLQESREREAKSNERNAERAAEVARADARETAISGTEQNIAELQQPASQETNHRGAPSKAMLDESFNDTMTQIRGEMGAPSRTFSKVIHAKPVEKTSEVVGSTVARPNALLAGGIGAFALTLAVYLIARHFGYPLSGFESIGAFILGWLVGMIIDYVRVTLSGRRTR